MWRAPTAKAENQHYVPEMLLQNFAVAGRGKEPQLHVFDKQTGRTFRTAIKKVVAERAFYDLPHETGAAFASNSANAGSSDKVPAAL